MSKSRLECNARCPAAGSIANALVKARYVLSSEFRLSSTSPIEGDTCDDLKRSWNKWWTSQLLVLKKERKRLKFEMAIKGCKRLFDKPCKRCDNPNTGEALTAWIRKMSVPHDFEVDPLLLQELQREVRKIVRGWGTRLKETRGALDSNPGHQGCLEVASGLGGGLATPQFGLIEDFGKCRLGSCKTKGKIRSVTMQSVYVKEKMRPIHNAIYDYLSTKDWLVRGDVSFSDFKAVCKGSDHIISGDYEGATDNIHSAAVNCIIDVLCEDENLTKKEVRILRGSFARPWWVHPYLGRGDIKRGSMMGNLVSFPLLCILNRACHIISIKRSGWSGSRVGRFNGDDCMFPGDKSLYDEWRKVTGGVGLIVNEEKTMFSNRFCELNSQAFDIVRDSLIGKISLNFFGLPRDSPGEILISTLDGIKPLKLSLQLEIVNRMMRYEISVRGAAIGSLSKFWQRQLIKRKWFRSLLDFGSAPVIKSKAESVLYPARPESQYIYSERKLEMVPGPLPKDEYVDACDEICVMVEKEHIAHWRGVTVKPITESHDRKQHKINQKGLKPNRSKVYTSIKHVWRYLWPKIVLDIVQDNFPDILRDKELYSREPVWNSNRISIKSIPSYYIKFRWNLPPPELALVPSYVRSNTDGGVKLEVL